MFRFKKIIIFLCSRNFKYMVKERANHMGLTIPEYLKFLAVKDIEEAEANLNGKK